MPDEESLHRDIPGACHYGTCDVPGVGVNAGCPTTGWRAGMGARALQETGRRRW